MLLLAIFKKPLSPVLTIMKQNTDCMEYRFVSPFWSLPYGIWWEKQDGKMRGYSYFHRKLASKSIFNSSKFCCTNQGSLVVIIRIWEDLSRNYDSTPEEII